MLAVYSFYSVEGIFYICFLTSLIGIYEFNCMAFIDTPHPWLKNLLFPSFGAILMGSSLFYPQYSDPFWAVIICLYICIYVWQYGSTQPNDWLFNSLTKAAIGFFYAVYLPVLTLKLLDLSHGGSWFLLLLLIVFSGDTFAFLGGLLFGRRKLSEKLSPNKTVEGSAFGFVGSALASLLMWYFNFKQISPFLFLTLGLIASYFAQTGDLFESLIKRIAQVKDSGRIMPGHGGVLDRIDGLLFASPIVYVFAFYAEKFLF